ncbi:MAG: peptide chain release factor N(5)-glutamine methyltransferase [Lachnospiraceae bacterium]
MRTTYQEILTKAEMQLKEAGVLEAELDAWYLFQYIFHVSRVNYFLDRMNSTDVNEEQYNNFFALIKKRASRIPIQYLTGIQAFMGMEFKVNESVLIPRQDTEILVEEVLKDCQNRKDLTLLDMCTGSGCIGISLFKLGDFSKAVLADISKDALAVANENAKKLDAKIILTQSDLFCNIDNEKFDVIVSNPPYIKAEVIETLEPEVKDCEPRLALEGPENGLFFYEKIAREALDYLAPGGRLYFEIGHDQGKDVSNILSKYGYVKIAVLKDLAGLDRVVKAIGGIYV